MENKEVRSPKKADRKTLYGYFEKGKRPTADNFQDLIFSTINKLDDGISKSFKYGLKLSPEGEDEKNLNKMENVITLFERIDSTEPSWIFKLIGKDDKKLCIVSGKTKKPLLTLTSDGKIGILEKNPTAPLEINGSAKMTGRIGTYEHGIVRANNSWHTITKVPLEGCKMFEITAFAYGKKGDGKYASIHAIASNAYSGRRGRIQCSRDYYGWNFMKRLKLRWIGTPFEYKLQIKTCCNYGLHGQIEYHITQLGKDFMFKEDRDNLNAENYEPFPEK